MGAFVVGWWWYYHFLLVGRGYDSRRTGFGGRSGIDRSQFIKEGFIIHVGRIVLVVTAAVGWIAVVTDASTWLFRWQ